MYLSFVRFSMVIGWHAMLVKPPPPSQLLISQVLGFEVCKAERGSIMIVQIGIVNQLD